MAFNNFVFTLKKKFAIVIALMLIGALGLAAEKYFTASPSTHLGGDAYIQCLTRLDNAHNVMPVLGEHKFFVGAPMELYQFIETHRDAFDYEKINGNWNGLNDFAKLTWLDKHLKVDSYEHGIYIFSLRLESSEPHDYEYVKANAAAFLDAYVEFARQECSKAGVGDLVKVERAALIPDSVTVTRRQLVYKHALIGATLGLIAGLIVIFGLSKRAATHG